MNVYTKVQCSLLLEKSRIDVFFSIRKRDLGIFIIIPQRHPVNELQLYNIFNQLISVFLDTNFLAIKNVAPLVYVELEYETMSF